MTRVLAAAVLALGALAPVAAPTAAEDPLMLAVGTGEDLQVLNPWSSILAVDREVYTLNYDLLVNFGTSIEPVPGFADDWDVSADGLTWTFHIRDGMTWSDGTPATTEDARWTYQLVLDARQKSNASEEGFSLGAGYLEGYIANAGVTGVSAPDAQTLIVETQFANTLLLQSYVPILPKHIWSVHTIEQIGGVGDEPFRNEPPVVGTGPYQVMEWTPGEFVRFARNPRYWGHAGAVDEIILLSFESADAMVSALDTGDVDYASGVQPGQLETLRSDPDIQLVEGFSNGYSEISFNTYSRRAIAGGGASTTALQDPAFRDALAWAIDQAKLVEVTLGGYGTPGDTIVPPFHERWHVTPDTPRAFDLDEAARRLDRAGYPMGADGRRLDKQGRPITLRVTWPDTEAEHETDAAFIKRWWESIGIGVDADVTERAALLDDLAPPEAGGLANFDVVIWGWVGDPDPTSLLRVLTSDEIGRYSDSSYENARYDELFRLQRAERDEAKRAEMLREMQNLVYDEAPYIVLYSDAKLHAYRTDRFGGWQNQPPDTGTPLFRYGSGGYTLLTELPPKPTPGPSQDASPTAVPSGDGGPATGGFDQTMLAVAGGLVVGALVVTLVAATMILRRRSGAAAIEDDRPE